MPVSSKMHAFQTEIGGREGLMPGGDAQDGAVIADPQTSGGTTARRQFPDAANQRFFRHKQDGQSYRCNTNM